MTNKATKTIHPGITNKVWANMVETLTTIEDEERRGVDGTILEMIRLYGKSKTCNLMLALYGEYEVSPAYFTKNFDAVTLAKAAIKLRDGNCLIEPEMLRHIETRLIEEVRATRLLKIIDHLDRLFPSKFDFILEANL